MRFAMNVSSRVARVRVCACMCMCVCVCGVCFFNRRLLSLLSSVQKVEAVASRVDALCSIVSRKRPLLPTKGTDGPLSALFTDVRG